MMSIKKLSTIAMAAILLGSAGTVTLAASGSGKGLGDGEGVVGELRIVNEIASLQRKLVRLADKLAMAQADGRIDKVAKLEMKIAETQAKIVDAQTMGIIQ